MSKAVITTGSDTPAMASEDPAQAVRDAMFGAALDAGDEDALAAECERRLRALSCGASLCFRTDHGRSTTWKMPMRPAVGEPPWATWARNAARALVAARRAEVRS